MLKNLAPSLQKITTLPMVKKKLQQVEAFYKKNPPTGIPEVKADDAKRSGKAKR